MANMTDTKGLYQITDYPMERRLFYGKVLQSPYRMPSNAGELLHL